MRKLIKLVPLLLVVLMVACGQKGGLYIPPEQESPAAAPGSATPTTAEDLDQQLEEGRRTPPAETQDEETLEGEEE